eukprot:TRINITY_DN95064_c0_g1_i1.p1 TRINITY_DN95064_c0_g1~~TRINITY_DN95064_c0_g1_i1.p1  ORF type:complete len:275 (+),score=8.53 TRINITY_DN95064_c0_g1_i1:29-853(+)
MEELHDVPRDVEQVEEHSDDTPTEKQVFMSRIPKKRNYIPAGLVLGAFVVGASLAAVIVWFVFPHRTKPIAEKCHTLSPTYPSAGGPDCAWQCPNNTKTRGTAFRGVFPDWYKKQFTAVSEIIKKHGKPTDIPTIPSLHISFSYYCCYNDTALQAIQKVLESYDWQPHDVKFDRVECRVDGPTDNHVSFIAMLDNASNLKMQLWVRDVEQKIAAAGIPIHVPRAAQERYHSTLGVVPGDTYPVQTALQDIWEKFPAWDSTAVRVTEPCAGKFFC